MSLYVEGCRSFFTVVLVLLIDGLWCVGKHGVVHGSLSQCVCEEHSSL